MVKKDAIELISRELYPLPTNCIEEFEAKATVRSVHKKEVVVAQGQISNRIFFVVEGALRAYYLKDGNDISDWFAFEGEFICAIQSYFSDLPSPHYIESIETSALLEISKADIQYLSEKCREFERLANVVTTQTMLRLQERIVSLQFETAQQKYLNLLRQRPNIEQRVPLTHIASYLGITIETLSRIRRGK